MSKKLSEMTLAELWQLFPIFLTEHKPYWAEWYSEEVDLLKSILPPDLSYYHIGSTAVNGIMAKPIIDIIVEVSSDMLESAADILEQHGYIKMSASENRISFNKGYTENGFAERVFHIHLRLNGDTDEVFFRDYLIAHPDIAKNYEKLKLELWKKYEHDRDGYTAAKTEFVNKYTALAKETGKSITRYPIILVHGIILKDNLFFKSFGKIGKILKSNGYTVYTAPIDGFGTIENNAAQLKDFVNKILEKENAQKVNLIAHSKGGLDSKYMIQSLGMEDKVASLTTLCTPHLGSPIASYILSYPKWLLKFIAFWINLWYRIFGDKHPNCLEVCKQLQQKDEADMISFSQKVYCQSYSTTLNRGRDDFVMGIPYYFSKRLEKRDTDGLVSVESSKFENYRGNCVDDSVSHSEIVGFMVKRKKKERIMGFYLQMLSELAEMGY